MLLMLEVFDGRVMIKSNSVVSDLIIDFESQDKTMTFLNQNLKNKVSINPIDNRSLIETYLSFNKTYQQTGKYNLTIRIDQINKNISKNFNIQELKNLEFVCFPIFRFQVFCYVLVTSTNLDDSIYIKDSDDSYTLQSQIVDFVGFKFPGEVLNYTLDRNKFLLVSSEFMLNTRLKGFKIFAIANGTVQIELVKFNFCGQSVSCMSYFSEKQVFNSYTILKKWNLYLNVGINTVLFEFPYSIQKGNLLLLTQDETKIGIDNSGNFIYDYMMIGFRVKRLDKIRFCLNSIIEEEMFLNYYEITKEYQGPGNKEITADLINLNLTIKRGINFNELRDIDFLCENKTIDFKVNCTFIAVSQMENNTFSLKFQDQKIKEFSILDSQVLSSFGIEIPMNLTNIIFPSNKPSNQILLLNSEFRFDCDLEGVELFVAISGDLKIELYSFSSCGLNYSCSNYITTNKVIPNRASLNLGTYKVQTGYKKILFDTKISAKKGNILMITQSSARLAIYRHVTLMYNDYYIIGNNISKIDDISANTALYLKALVNESYFKIKSSFEMEFTDIGINELSLIFNDLKVTSYVNVTNDYIMDFGCINNNKSFDLTIICYLYQKSKSSRNMVKVDFEDNASYIIGTSGMFSFFS
ncbi:unnamed protein product [Brachionus calyciflorus]|uniref:Uncharacterized protein n=1 Tax=Brachionus calyciflorus TaxID=104777 RepID=A0A814DLS5_9BILA|nr:unnamed protein product [Brachionus calyciflorus]